MPASLKLQWRLQNASYNSAIVVTVSYWAYIALLDRGTDTPDLQTTTMSQVKHTVNTVYVVVDIMISATPFRVLHLLYTVILGSLYSLFNAVYFLSDGTMSEGRHYAYNLLNWSQPEEAVVTCVLGVVMCVISQLIMYALYKIRTILFIKMYFGSSSEKPGSELEGIMGRINSAEYIAVQNEDSEQSQERNATESCN